eukprot:12132289-Alexandrium_andersonii.AAC.1
MISHSNWGRRGVAPRVALLERSRSLAPRPSGGSAERALKGLCGGGPASLPGRLGHRQVARGTTCHTL